VSLADAFFDVLNLRGIPKSGLLTLTPNCKLLNLMHKLGGRVDGAADVLSASRASTIDMLARGHGALFLGRALEVRLVAAFFDSC
jgi:hypothetical protein